MNKKLNAEHLKIIAIITMFIDHFVVVFINHETVWGQVLRISGRVVAPMMCYMIAQGYYKTSNLNKYLGRLFVFALISHIPYNIAIGYSFFQATSVMWGLALGLLALKIVKTENLHIIFKVGAVALCCLLSITANWNYIAVLWIVGFGIFYGDFKKQMIAFCIIAFFAHIVPNIINFGLDHEPAPHWYQLGVFLTIPLLWQYNGERGNDILKMGKYGFYIFYPAHLLLLYLLNRLTPLQELLGEVIK